MPCIISPGCSPAWYAGESLSTFDIYFLLLYSWVSKPTPSISASILSWCVSFIHMMIYSIMSYVPCFAHCSYLDVYYFERFHWKTSYLWTPANYQLFFDQELSLPLPIMIHFMYLYCVSFTHCKLSYIIVSCLLLWSMYWWMWCFLSVFFYRLFTP